MAKIYSAPKSIKLPKFDFLNSNHKKMIEDERKYIADLKQHIKEMGYTEVEAGEIIKFPVADGYAQYMILSLKPVRLIHIELGDAYAFQYVNLLKAKDVREKLRLQKAFNEIFSKN